MKKRLHKFFKNFILYTRILSLLAPLNQAFLFIRNFNRLTQWIRQNNRKNLLVNDYFVFHRNYEKRMNMFRLISEHYELNSRELVYLEFGVASGHSFFWWVNENKHPGSRFWGFDSFEGLPEDWGFYKKGDMSFAETDATARDARADFVKGYFQNTLPGFLRDNGALISGKSKLIHLDADLFSSTIFCLSQLYPFLQKGDILIFDEFNVANHEFMAYQIFTEAFYVKLKLIGAQNNFYQTAFVVE